MFDIVDCNAARSDKDRGICTIGKLTKGSNDTFPKQNQYQDINETTMTFMFKETVENHVNGKS